MPVGGDDEIGELNTAFTELHEGMKYMNQELKEAYADKSQKSEK